MYDQNQIHLRALRRWIIVKVELHPAKLVCGDSYNIVSGSQTPNPLTPRTSATSAFVYTGTQRDGDCLVENDKQRVIID